MKFSRSVNLCVTAAAVLGAWAARAELGRWVEHLDLAAKLEDVFFREVSLPGGTVNSRRPPAETTAGLTRALAAQPARSDLLYLRARERELSLDFPGAEQDWKAYASAGTTPLQARLALADFYHRRLEPEKELNALIEAGRVPSEGLEGALDAPEQASWKIFERAVKLAAAQALPPASAAIVYDAWLERYPRSAQAFEKAFDSSAAARDWPRAEAILQRYSQAFPDEEAFPVRARATLAERRGGPSDALAVYAGAWNPLWPPELIKSYFQLMEKTHTLHAWLADARNAIAARPTELGPAVRLFYYHQQRGDLRQAWRALHELRLRRQAAQSAWPTAELVTVARLFEATNNAVDAARYYVQAYEMDRTAGASAEEALGGLANLLLASADQPVSYGAGDLTYYRDIATMDRGPGVLNGILSLVLNTTWPQAEFAQQQSAATGYFHRAKAAELVAEFNARFPQSGRRPSLNALIIDAYAKHAEDAGVIRRGTAYLAEFPKAPERVDVALAMADAYARGGQTVREFSLYDALLKELAAEKAGFPIAKVSGEPAQPPRANVYARVLDRYLARLVAMRRLNDALALYRREIDRNPNDPGLYERLAQFMTQNRLDARVAEVYSRAARQFADDRSWYGKLARWHLRRKQTAAFAKVAQEAVGVFSGSDLEKFFREVVTSQPVGPALYVQLNKYAHERFPHDLVFVRNLLNAYESGPTADAAAYEQLLRAKWYYSEDLRRRFFSFLSRTNRLDAELKALAALPETERHDRAAQQFIAEGHAWQGHFEQAAEPLERVSEAYPGDAELALRTSAIYRSLDDVPKAIAAAERMARYAPRDTAAITRAGEIYAERDQFARARPYWDRIPRIEPGRAEGYLEAATVYWDYYLYDDALRVIGDARKRLGAPALFAYEAGAIHEGKREWNEAVSEYVAGAAASLDSPARRRLTALSRRPALKPAVEEAVAKLSPGPEASDAAFALRVAMLEEQQRRDVLTGYLEGLVPATRSPELLVQISAVAERQGLDGVRTAAIRREVEISNDPVERIRLRLSLARFREARNDIATASSEMQALYREHPTVLGVVRAAVDFEWRNKRASEAIEILTASAARANAVYRRQFLVEAGRKANEAADYARARDIVAPLLAAEPAAADLIAIEADSYARAGDDESLRKFYAARLQEVRDPVRRQGLRRTLIPVLTRLKDYAGSIDQYVEILNQYPDDRGLLAEAAAYAREHAGRDRLMAYYTKAAAASPRDARWPILIARLCAEFEELPGAVAAYTRAIAIRPERQDLFMERASLEERLRQWDAAAASYARLYELAYHNPHWMAKVAEQRARQGRRTDAVQALRTAFIDGRPARAGDYFEAARLLESWDMLAEAAEFAEGGLGKLDAGEAGIERDLEVYLRIAMRRRDYSQAYARISRFVDEPAASRLWKAAGSVAGTWYTPEEKEALAAYLEVNSPHDPQIAISAGLMDVAARWMTANRRTQELITLEQSRMRFGPVAAALEGLAKTAGNTGDASSLLAQAAENYRTAGEAQNELRVLLALERSGTIGEPLLARLGELLRTSAPDRLVELARSRSSSVRNSAAQTAVGGSDGDFALRVIAARSAGMPPVWGRAYTALAGLYFGRTTPEISSAFEAALGPRSIGEQLAHPADRNQQLAGDDWFYYGACYGEFLALSRQPGADDYVVSEVEGRPASDARYLALADWYRDGGDYARAIAEYGHALELSPGRADAHSRLAAIYAAQGDKGKAADEWRAALSALAAMQDSRRVPDEFWTGLDETVNAISAAGMLDQLRSQVDRLIATYVHRNGLFRIEAVLSPLLKSGASASDEALSLARSARNPTDFLGGIVEESWFPEAARGVVFARLVELAEADVASQFGDARSAAEYRVRDFRVRQAGALLAARQYREARQIIQRFSERDRRELGGALTRLELLTATGLNDVEAALRRYDENPELAPPRSAVLEAGASLRREGWAAAARRVLEFVYTRALAEREFSTANFLGLAEVKLASGDTAGAVAALRRLMLVGQDGFDALTPAAELLERFGKPAEAREFWMARVSAAPWDATALVAVAKAASDQKELLRLAAAAEAPYAARVRAAGAVSGPASLGSAELDALTAGSNPSAAGVSKPYFHFARIGAAGASKDALLRLRLLREALEIDPGSASTRLAVFDAAVAANRPAAAVGALHGLTGAYSEDSDVPAIVYPYQVEHFLRPLGVEDAARARIALGLASANRKLGRLPAAIYCLHLAARLDSSLKTADQIAAIMNKLELAKKNRARMPVVNNGTAQPNPVRPRLTSVKVQGGGV
ncbi:MAG TPA: tetratricopeptide repeat protein [Bryobacteraceae bacterium]|nr:tetratricopeptide repeat protein [Bryobacteraceae bacterium]